MIFLNNQGWMSNYLSLFSLKSSSVYLMPEENNNFINFYNLFNYDLIIKKKQVKHIVFLNFDH